MIITDDNFSTIVKGVEEGRKAYNNIRKVIYLLLSTGFSEIILFVLSIIFNLPIPLLAIQLLWLNLITNGVQGDALAFEEDKENVLNKKMVFMENIQIFNCRSESISMFKISGTNNRFLIISIIITLCIQAIIVRIPEAAGFFGLTTIPIQNIGMLFLGTIPLIVGMEIFKRVYVKSM